MISTTLQNNAKKILKIFLCAVFWLMVWHICAVAVNKAWVLPTPESVLETLVQMAGTSTFWKSIFNSLYNVILGFVIGVLSGAVLSIVTFFVPILNTIIGFALTVMRTTPVACFIMLLWVFASKEVVPATIVILVVMPIVHANMSEGFKNIDKKQLEVARVFEFSLYKKFKYIYFKAIAPHFRSAVLLSVGLAFKSGIAAEVLCDPINSVGHGIFSSKRDILTSELFAWTLVVIILCFAFETAVKLPARPKLEAQK